MSDIYSNRDSVVLIVLAVIAVCCGVVMGWIRDQQIGDYDNLCFAPLVVGFIFVFLFYKYHNRVINVKYGKVEDKE